MLKNETIGCRPALLALAFAGTYASEACAQTLADAIDIEGTVTGSVNASVTYDGVTATGSTTAVWDETGLISGTGGLSVAERLGRVSVNRSFGDPVRKQTFANSTVTARATQRFNAIMSHNSFGSTPVSVVYDASWTLTASTTVRITDFVISDVDLTDSGNFQFTNGSAIGVSTLQADEGETRGHLSGPRGLSISDDASGLLLIPGEYAMSYNATGSVYLSGTLVRSGVEVARYGAGGAASILLTAFAAVPAAYDLNGDSAFTIDDLRMWREQSSSGDAVYDTLDDGSIGDEDRAELFRALSFSDPTAIEDCDGNGRHDPFEIAYDGVTPPCASPCPADLAEPFGQLTFADITAFLGAFTNQDGPADLADPFGQFTFADITAFLTAFAAGCP